MGLGAYPDVSPAKARLKAADARQAVAEGRLNKGGTAVGDADMRQALKLIGAK